MANGNYIRFTDVYSIKPGEVSQTIRDNFLQLGPPASRRYRTPTQGSRSLTVKVAATHAGKVTLNNGFYLPDRMKSGVPTWTAPYPKPFLLHHDDHDDAVGRVLEANYKDTSADTRQLLNSTHGQIVDAVTISDQLIDAWLTGSLPLKESAKVATQLIIKNEQVKKHGLAYPGLGFIELTAALSDADTIQKVLDGRFLTGSVGANTNHAFCSVCNQDWAEEGPCEHRPGKEYDSSLCVLIAGDLEYQEWSYVNHPADVHSGTIEIYMDGQKKDSFSSLGEDSYVPEVSLNITDSVEDPAEEEGILASNNPIDALKKVLGDDYFILVEEDESAEDIHYASMIVDALTKVIEDEDGNDLTVIKEKKLSSAERKEMPSSTFCKPGERKYPVPDCCLTYDTQIRLLDGTEVPIGSLIERLAQGEELWTYGFNLDRMSIVPVRIAKVWKARENAPLLKITLDNGTVIRCTDNHPFLTRQGTYISAGELKSGQSLMPIYTKMENEYGNISPDQLYEKIYQPWYGYWEYTHRMVARETFGVAGVDLDIVHHKNNIRTNNVPSNLESMSKADHLRMHNLRGDSHIRLSKEGRVSRSAWMSRKMAGILANPELANEHSCKISAGKHQARLNLLKAEHSKTIDHLYGEFCGGATLKAIAQKYEISEPTLRCWFRDCGYETNRVILSLTSVGLTPELAKERWLAGELSVAELTRSTGISDYMIRKTIGIDCNNHTILSIQSEGCEDVYDIEVPATENLALAVGVFVHNSHAKVAMAYAKKNNESSSVVSCISRKASRLGCPFGKGKDMARDFGTFTVEYFDQYEDAVLLQLFEGVKNTFLERKIDCQTVEQDLTAIKNLQENVEQLQSEKQGLEDSIGCYEEEKKEAQVALEQNLQALRDLSILHLIMLQELAGQEMLDKQVHVQELAKKDLSELKKLIDETTTVVDTKQIADRLKSGLANDPAKLVVADPTLGQTVEDAEQQVVVTKEMLETIQAEYTSIRMRSGQVAAERYLEDLKRQGKLPRTI